MKVYSGQTGGLVFSYQDTQDPCNTDKTVGYALAGAGDVNSDGYPDIVVGARLYDNYRGRVRVLSGLDGSVLHVWTGPSTYQEFGGSVAGAGDWNGDGYADVAAGAPTDNTYATLAAR